MKIFAIYKEGPYGNLNFDAFVRVADAQAEFLEHVHAAKFKIEPVILCRDGAEHRRAKEIGQAVEETAALHSNDLLLLNISEAQIIGLNAQFAAAGAPDAADIEQVFAVISSGEEGTGPYRVNGTFTTPAAAAAFLEESEPNLAYRGLLKVQPCALYQNMAAKAAADAQQARTAALARLSPATRDLLKLTP